MPVYIRRNASFTPASGDDFEDDPTDFLQNPELQRDQLPQPFRMLDKILQELLDQTWDVISSRESERLVEASKFRPPQYQCSIAVLQDHGTSSSLCATPDGTYIIGGQADGVIVINSETQELVDLWKEEKMQIVSVQISKLGEEIYLINTIDDMGLGRVFSLARQKLFLLHTLSDQDSPGKVLVNKCHASAEGDYLGVHVTKPSTQENWLDIHKLPKEIWLKELDGIAPKIQKQSTDSAGTSPALGNDDETNKVNLDSSTPIQDALTLPDNEVDATDEQRIQSPASHKNDRHSHKFSDPTMLLRVRAPTSVKGVTYTSAAHAVKTVDANGDVIGSGVNHLMTSQHLEQRSMMFEQLHAQHKESVSEEDKSGVMQLPTFHFLRQNRMLPQGLEQPSNADQPSSVAVLWSNETQLMQYSLLKQGKDLEHKADVVMPLSSPIVASAVSASSSLMALALKNGNLVFWDNSLGTSKGVIHITNQAQITKLVFLDPSVCPEDSPACLSYSKSTNSYVMIYLDNGQMFLANSSKLTKTDLEAVDLNVEDDASIPSLVEPMSGVPDLLITCRQNGSVYLHDLLRGNQLCQVVLPDEYEIATPWEPLIAVGNNGGMMYIKGTLKDAGKRTGVDTAGDAEAEDDENGGRQRVTNPTERLFVFTLRSFPSLDKYREKQKDPSPYAVQTTIDERVDQLLRHRISQQSARKDAMQERWGKLKDELEWLKQLRHSAKQNRATGDC